MSTVKITELGYLTMPANTQNVILVAVDKSGSNPVTKQTTLAEVGNTLNQVSLSAYRHANAAFDTANTVAYAYGQANTATSDAARADQRAVTSGDYANSAFNLANAASVYVTSGGVYANAAYTKANVASIDALSAGSYANGAFSLANGAMIQAYTANTLAQSAYVLANTASYDGNNAFIKANSAYVYTSNVESNTVIIGAYANGAYGKANTVNAHSVSAYDTANSALSLAVASNVNSLIIVTSAPETPVGNTGDETGMVYMTNVAFFYCTANYDGSTNIWSKITSSDAW